MTTTASLLRDILNPGRVAVVGASADPGKFGGRVMRFLLQHGYGGQIVPVHPSASDVLGLAAFRHIREAPAPVDVALIAVPATAMVETLDACGAAGVRCCLILTADYAETGSAGAEKQRELVRIARGHGMRLIGPNCLGFINPRLKLALTSSVALAVERMPAGPIGLASQSGSLMASLISHAQDLGTGFTAAVSVGNQADLDTCDFIEYFIDDPATRVICAYVESMPDGARFLALADRARAACKPVIVVNAGRTDAGVSSVRSHTASLAGSHAVFAAACRDRAVCLLDDPESLIQCAAFLASFPAPATEGIAAFSPSGGTIAVVADRIAGHGLTFASLARATRNTLADWFPPSRPVNPLDTGGLAREKSMGGAMAAYAAYAADPNVGLILAAVATTPQLDEKVRRWGEAALRLKKPTIMLLTPGSLVDGARAALRNMGCPYVNRLDDALRVARAAIEYGRSSRIPPDAETQPAWRSDIAAAVDRLPAGPLPEIATKALLRTAGIATTADRIAATADEAIRIAESIGYPVVLKGISESLVHKSDAGAVCIGLQNEPAVRAAFSQIAAAVARHADAARFDGCLVANHVGGGIEFIIGARRDPQFGAVVIVGAGGVLVELLDDVALALAPLSADRARAMVAGLRAGKLLRGVRGAPAADHAALIDALVRASWIAATLGPRLVELDVNPIAVLPAGRGAIALDARATLAAPGDRIAAFPRSAS